MSDINVKPRFLVWLLVLLMASACEQQGSSSDNGEDGDSVVSAPQIDFSAPLLQSRASSANPSVGEVVVIEISAMNFPESQGGGFDLQFDPAIVQVENVEIDPGWDFVNRSGLVDNAGGAVSGILFSSYAGRSGSIAIATVTLRVIAGGESQLRLVESELNPFASLGRRFAVQLLDNTLVAG